MPYANVFAPMGFISLAEFNPDKHVLRNVAGTRTPVGAAASAAIAIGDAYAIDATGNAYHSGADGTVRGVVIGFDLNAVASIMNGNGPISQDFLPATDAGRIIGIEDSNVEFLVVSDSTVGFVAANIGAKYNLGDAAPDALFRQSRQFLIVNGGAGTQFTALRLDAGAPNQIGVVSPDNAYGPSARVVVKLATAY